MKNIIATNTHQPIFHNISDNKEQPTISAMHARVEIILNVLKATCCFMYVINCCTNIRKIQIEVYGDIIKFRLGVLR